MQELNSRSKNENAGERRKE